MVSKGVHNDSLSSSPRTLLLLGQPAVLLPPPLRILMWNASRTCLLLVSIPFWLAGEEGECRTGPVSHNSLSLVTGKFRIGKRKVAEAGKWSHSAVFWKVQLIPVKALFFLAPGPVSFWVISEKQPKGVFQHLISRLASMRISLRI